MTSSKSVLAFVMAGGIGSRLQPLTATCCKPALPFGAHLRVVDFVLDNLLNSGLEVIEVLAQYRPQALAEHLRRRRRLPSARHATLALALPAAGRGAAGYRGTADAVHQNLARVRALRPDLVCVFGADHIYRMDVRQMIDFHVAQRAHVTVSTLPVPLAQAQGLGIVSADDDQRIEAFQEKPSRPAAMPGRPAEALASMGNYVFDADVLCSALARAHERGETDFGHHVLPGLLKTHRVMAYDFSTGQVPGLMPSEARGYWRDIGSIDAYFAAHQDTLDAAPKFSLANRLWPIGAYDPCATRAGWHCSVGTGAVIGRAVLDHAFVGPGVRVDCGATLDRTIVMGQAAVGAGARLRRVIVDRDNFIPPGEIIGHDRESDRRRFPLSPEGVVVVPRGYYAPAANRALRSSEASA